MNGNLLVGRNSVTGLANPVNDTYTANKHHVDSHQAIIAIWAEKKRHLVVGEHHCSFRHSSGAGHQKYVGYIIPVSWSSHSHGTISHCSWSTTNW